MNDNGTIPFKPRVIPTKPSDHLTPNEDVVKLLEEYLASAKEGKIQFIGVATVSDKGIAYSNWEPEQAAPQLLSSALGAVGFLGHRFARACDDGGVEDDGLRPDPVKA